MRCCWSHSDNSVNMIAPGVLLIGVLCICSIIREGFAAENRPDFIAVYLVLFIMLYASPLFVAFVSARKYKLSSDGILIVYPLGIKELYSWSDFSEIALCKIHYASGSMNHVLGIRCAIGSETCVPKNATVARGQWSTMTYELTHFRKLVSIYYTSERYEEFVRFCPYSINDYQTLKDRA